MGRHAEAAEQPEARGRGRAGQRARAGLPRPGADARGRAARRRATRSARRGQERAGAAGRGAHGARRRGGGARRASELRARGRRGRARARRRAAVRRGRAGAARSTRRGAAGRGSCACRASGRRCRARRGRRDGGARAAACSSPPLPVAAFATARLLRAGRPGRAVRARRGRHAGGARRRAAADAHLRRDRLDGAAHLRAADAAGARPGHRRAVRRRRRGDVRRRRARPDGGGAARRALHALALADDIVYVREAALFAFEEIAALGERARARRRRPTAMRVVQFRGTGRLVVRAARAAFTLKIEPERRCSSRRRRCSAGSAAWCRACCTARTASRRLHRVQRARAC